ncbi:MAG: DUF3808 domain-containing protein [Ignavibacteriae bacterium]|nr:DUF3808 domain-containing protein [Ignavibacteriota bacterium]
MRKLIPILHILLVLACLVSAAHAQSIVTTKADATDWARVHDLTVRGIDELYNLQMDLAERTFNEVIRMAPDDPRGYFFKAMIHFWVFTLNKEEKEFDAFFALTDTVINICDKLLERDKNDVYATFFLGGAYGYRGIAYQRNGSLLKAAWDGRKGYSYLKDAIALKPDLHDAQMGFGMFSYLVGKVPKSYRWLLNILGFSGDIEGGLASLKQAAEKGTYTRTEAAFLLAQFLNVEHREEEGRAYMLKLIDQYPENALFLVTFAQWEYRDERIASAVEAAEKVIAISERRKLEFGDEFAYSVLGNCYYVKNDFARAVKNFEMYLEKIDNKDNVTNNVYVRLGTSYEALGNREKAIAAYKQARLVEDSQWQNRHFQTAQARIRTPLSNMDLMLIKADNTASLKEYQSAIRMYRDVLKANPNVDQSATAMYGMVEAQYDLEQYEQSIQTALELVKLQPMNETSLIPNGYYRLGLAYAKLGKVEDARRAFEAVSRYKNYDGQSRLEGGWRRSWRSSTRRSERPTNFVGHQAVPLLLSRAS